MARCLVVWTVASAVCAAGLWLCLGTAVQEWRAPGAPSGRPFDRQLVLGCAALGGLCLVRVWLVSSLTVAAAVRGRALDDARGLLRRLVLAACGGALVLGAGAPAVADPGGNGGASAVIAGLPYPDRASTEGAAAEQRTVTTSPGGPTRVVRTGDTLWAIAEESLPAGAPTSAVDAGWRRIHRSNVGVLGDDPHLIHPGQELVLSGADGDTSGADGAAAGAGRDAR